MAAPFDAVGRGGAGGRGHRGLPAAVPRQYHDAESLLREAASSTGDKAAELRERALTSLKRTREALYEAQDAVLERGRKAARATDDYVHDNPWQAIGIAGVTGLLLGLLISRR